MIGLGSDKNNRDLIQFFGWNIRVVDLKKRKVKSLLLSRSLESAKSAAESTGGSSSNQNMSNNLWKNYELNNNKASAAKAT